MDTKLKITSLVFSIVLIAGFATAQANFDKTSEDNPSFGESSFSKQSFFDSLSSIPSLSFFDAPSQNVEPGSEIKFEFENDISFSQNSPDVDGDVLGSGNAKYVVEVYDCGVRCGDNDEFIDGIRFQNFDLEVGELKDGDTIQGSTRYTIPERSDGPHSATAYIWVQGFTSDNVDNDGDGRIDEQDEALVSDAPSAEFTVSGDAPEGGDRTVSPSESFSDFVLDNLLVVVVWLIGIGLVVAYLVDSILD